MTKTIGLDDVKKAYEVIYNHIEKTPTGYSRSSSQWVGSPIHLKYENLQMTGSFKVRGALNKISSLTNAEKQKGIVASSAGNHAQGVAFSAAKNNVQAHIVMPKYSSLIKQQATRGYGAKVFLHGDYYDQSYEYAKKLEQENGYVFVHPYNDPLIIAGQGTIALEILQDLKNIDSIVVPIGGGGLISGIATTIRALNPKCKIYGVVAHNAAAMMGLYKNNPKEYCFQSQPTIADGIAVKTPNEFMFQEYIKKYVDDVISVTDEEIAESIVYLLERSKTVSEGSAAAALAGVKKAQWKLGEKNVVVLSGGNIDLNLMASVIEKGLQKYGRLVRIRVRVPDRPGQLLSITKIIAEEGANVLEVFHDRFSNDLRLKETIIEFLIETIGPEQSDEIVKKIKNIGAEIL